MTDVNYFSGVNEDGGIWQRIHQFGKEKIFKTHSEEILSDRIFVSKCYPPCEEYFGKYNYFNVTRNRKVFYIHVEEWLNAKVTKTGFF